MIGKIKKGKSFGGCIRYVMGKDNAEIIDSDGVLLGNIREITDSFNYQRELNPKIKQPVGHIALSFKPEDKALLTDEWNSDKECLTLSTVDMKRYDYLSLIQQNIEWDNRRFLM